jgi:hypothetical protein
MKCGSHRTKLLAALALLVAAGASAAELDAPSLPASLRLNQIQVVGTHNSYHLEPPSALAAIGQSAPIRAVLPAALSASFEYSHRSLTDQLAVQRVRQLELDLFPDPDGGRYREPLGQIIAQLRGETFPATDTAALARPGFKILHKPEFDYRTNTPTFLDALQEIRAWSDKNPRHIPVLIILELKVATAASGDLTVIADPRERALIAALKPSPAWTDDDLADVETEILSVFPLEKILTPSQVRGDAATLREAILTHGWPELDALRGRVMFALDNENTLRERYLALAKRSSQRLLFVSVPPDHAEAAWMKINNPVRDFARIQDMVRAGFLVRTRADEELREARTNDTHRRDLAFASGAQFISTDFPEQDLRYSQYRVRLPNDASVTINPVSASTASPSVPVVAP